MKIQMQNPLQKDNVTEVCNKINLENYLMPQKAQLWAVPVCFKDLWKIPDWLRYEVDFLKYKNLEQELFTITRS